MFPRHARTRRQLVLLGFSTLCIVPTLGVVAWCVGSRLPWRPRAEAAWIGHLVGMNATLDEVRRPRPDTMLYCGLSLADRESGRPAFSCRRVEIRRGVHDVEPAEPAETASGDASGGRSEKSAQRRPAVYAAFGETRCYAEHSDQWLRLIESLLARRIGPDDADLRCTFDRLEIRRDDRSLTLTDVTATVVRTSDETSLEIEFRAADVADGPRGRIRATRNRESTPHATQFELTCTEPTAVPCELLGCFAPVLATAPTQSDFSGRLLGRQSPDGWHYDVVDGLFRNVKLGQLLGNRFAPHRIEATVDIQVHKASIAAGRLTFAEGSLDGGEGWMSRSLAEACMTHLGLEGVREADPGGVSYQGCQARFLLDDRGLQLAAFPRNGKTIAFTGDRPIFDEPPRSTIVPIASLLNALAPRPGPALAALEENAARARAGAGARARAALREWLPLESEHGLAERPSGQRR